MVVLSLPCVPESMRHSVLAQCLVLGAWRASQDCAPPWRVTLWLADHSLCLFVAHGALFDIFRLRGDLAYISHSLRAAILAVVLLPVAALLRCTVEEPAIALFDDSLYMCQMV